MLHEQNNQSDGSQEGNLHKAEFVDQQVDSAHPKRPHTSWWQRRRIRVATTIIFIILVIPAIVVIPIIIKQQERASSQQEPVTLDDNSQTRHPDPYDDSAQANIFVPPLSEDFQYETTPVRGINLGGWLVLEPFITPSLFENAPDLTKKPEERQDINDHVAVDEWTLCQRLGPTNAKQVLERHYETFITESDFERIREMGFNHVRIPIGHWAIRPLAHEPFVPHLAWTYLLRGIQWARKYGLRVMVELHTAPGSQNGWNHSGRLGEIRWLNGANGQRYGEETARVIKDIITFFNTDTTEDNDETDINITTETTNSSSSTASTYKGNKWSHVFPLFGVLNEPAIMSIDKERAKQWYRESYSAIRNITGRNKGPILSYHDGFLGLPPWKGFFKGLDRAFLETHMYMIFDPNLVYMAREKQANFPCQTFRQQLSKSSKDTAPIMVGEFSFATNDCGKYLNGVGLGTRYENTMNAGGDVSQCRDCNCTQIDDWSTWTDDYKQFLNTFVQRQMDAYEASVGWFFWTYKTEQHVNPHWDYSLAWEKGWAPKDVNNREYSCHK